MLIDKTVPANLAELRTLLGGIDEICAAAGTNADFHADCKLMAEEAVVNVMKHSDVNKPGGKGVLRLMLTLEDHAGFSSVRLDLQDDGSPFNPLLLSTPDLEMPLEHRPVGGLGVVLMRQLSDSQSYQYVPGVGNWLTLIKHLPTQTAP